jgi:hypothetical protein
MPIGAGLLPGARYGICVDAQNSLRKFIAHCPWVSRLISPAFVMLVAGISVSGCQPEALGEVSTATVTAKLSATEQGKLVANNAAPRARFGNAVAVEGDTALISAPGPVFSSIYHFERSGGVWTQQAELKAPTPWQQSDDFLGGCLAMSGDTAVAAAPHYDGIESATGSASAFVRNAGTWSYQVQIPNRRRPGGNPSRRARARVGETPKKPIPMTPGD